MSSGCGQPGGDAATDMAGAAHSRVS